MSEGKAKEQNEVELPLDALVLQCEKDRYKIGYASLRWAKEIKQKENLPEPIPHLVPRALREILTGKVDLKEVEKLPVVVKITAQPTPTPGATSTPTLKVNTEVLEEEQKTEKASAEAKAEEKKEEQKESDEK